MKSKKSLFQFLVEGQAYQDTFFNRDLVYLLENQFTVNPRSLMDQAFQNLGLIFDFAAQDDNASKLDVDGFVYQAWYGDLRATLKRQGGMPAEFHNIDRFLLSLATIPTDQRYEAPQYAMVKPFASRFQKSVVQWIEDQGPAQLASTIKRVRTPQPLVAIAEKVCERLGLVSSADTTITNVEVRRLYGQFRPSVHGCPPDLVRNIERPEEHTN